MINRIQSSNNVVFNAKLWEAHTSNEQVCKLFEQQTRQYPDLILIQDRISFFGEDHFFLFREKENKRLAFVTASFTNNHPKSIGDCAKRFVEIFHMALLEAKIKK